MKGSLSAIDLGSLLEVTERTLRRWEEDGTGPKRIIENLQPVYPLESLVPWLRKHRPDVKLGAAARIIDAAGRLALLENWERRLCARYTLKSTEVLYEALRHADFHETGNGPSEPDKLEHWNLASYAAFSGVVVRHKLGPEQLQDLLAHFRARHDLGLAAKRKLSTAEFAEEIEDALTEEGFKSFDHDGPYTRQLCDYIAVAHRYACATSGRYDFPPREPCIAGLMTPAEQELAFAPDGFVACVMEKGNPAGKWARLACERHLEDLLKSRAASAR
jgi:hypothetical protein